MILTKEGEQYKLTKDLLDQMRSLDGFPIGKDEDIIALSDPPYYTASPNPWIAEFIKEYGKPYDPKTDSYNREPFATDVSEGKNDLIYKAQSYHTKVPHKAIMRYILHYTEPGDIVFDGFCGTGMTGVAAQNCSNPDPEFKEQIEREMPGIKWGGRKAILNDLSPAATLLAYNYNIPVGVKSFEDEAHRILTELENECGWMYETQHVLGEKPVYEQNMEGGKTPVKGIINYTVWSDVFVCPVCSKEIIFWEIAVDHVEGKIKDNFSCPYCNSYLTKRSLERAWTFTHDEIHNQNYRRAKQIPVMISYTVYNEKQNKQRFEKKPDKEDLALINKIESIRIPHKYPSDKLPSGEKTKDLMNVGIYYVDQFYTKRNLWTLAAYNSKIVDKSFKVLNNAIGVLGSLLYRFRWIGGTPGRGGGPLAGTYYIPSLSKEMSIIHLLREHFKKIVELKKEIKKFSKNQNIRISTTSATQMAQISTNSVDYIFTDPPFGSNLMYSELNFVWEAWLKVFTNNQNEAIINNSQKKGLQDYQKIMELCFQQYYRILKPGRWMTVEFHNSQNSVWMAIQESLQRAGFVVADVRVLDKKQGSFNQVQGTGQSVKQDLIISAYKANGGLEERFKLIAGTMEGVWGFVRQHLKHLPIFVEKRDIVQIVAERQPYLLFDRMVAFHVQRGVIVPISAGDFYAGLRQRFPEREGMYFLENEVLEYDKKRMTTKRIEQVSLFVHDEKSAVNWLHKELSEKSQTYQDIQPKFLQELHQDDFEEMPELTIMLEQNFLRDMKGQWYVPDSNKLADLDKVRDRALLKEFDEYKKTKGKLKLFRTEAVRSGFKKAWSERDYGLIILIGERLPTQILQEDDVLLMYYDNALTRSGSK